ncbi:MAG: hypothetical protein OXG51_03185 [Gammaproteobacteria bacterium]|nr:hypothetical protein [Gammaproteobacteria bacterium]
MSRLRKVLGWAGIVVLGLVHGVLEDLLFLNVLVPYMPPSWDLTGNLYFTFTVPLAQLMAVGITGTLAWFFLGLRETPRLITFWACWSVARAAFLTRLNNPVEDVLIYLSWIALWCALIWLLARFMGSRDPVPAG